ncbi:MAG TPA: protease pro-enzyme activation domain-containing protein, partial [Ktedonobacterales bacterium]|nr:protease pro-enzyme activation domain-containing protein [Ktedonobacterales bacterium]
MRVLDAVVSITRQSRFPRLLAHPPKLLGIFIALLLLSGCGGSTTPPSQQTNATYVPPLPALSGLPAAALQAKLLGLKSLTDPVSLTIGLQINRQALAEAAQDINDPASPHFGQYLSPEQIAEQFGASTATIQHVTTWLTQQGFQILSTSPLRNTLIVQGSVLQIAKAFQVVLQNMELNGRDFFGPNQAPVLPSDIAPLITSITGLDNFAHLQHPPSQSLALKNQLSQLSTSAAQVQTPRLGDCTLYSLIGVTRDNLAQDYAFDALYQKGIKGQGMKIGIVEVGEPYDHQDVANYAACNGFKLQVRNINVDGKVPAGSGEGEAALDLEMIAGLAPGAQLIDYQAPQPDDKSFLDVLNQIAIDDQVQVASISYGEGEDQTTPAYMAQYEETLELLAVEGVSVFISSGDCAAFVDGDGTYGRLQVSFPASAPWAIGVGGTSLDGGEHAWSASSPNKAQCQNTWGTGGGLSQNKNFPRPPWQTGQG